MCQFAACRFNQELIQVFFRKILKIFLFIASLLPNRSAIRQQVLPSADPEYLVINATVLFKTMVPKKESGWRKHSVWQIKTDKRCCYLQYRPDNDTQHNCPSLRQEDYSHVFPSAETVRPFHMTFSLNIFLNIDTANTPKNTIINKG